MAARVARRSFMPDMAGPCGKKWTIALPSCLPTGLAGRQPKAGRRWHDADDIAPVAGFVARDGSGDRYCHAGGRLGNGFGRRGAGQACRPPPPVLATVPAAAKPARNALGNDVSGANPLAARIRCASATLHGRRPPPPPTGRECDTARSATAPNRYPRTAPNRTAGSPPSPLGRRSGIAPHAAG